MSIGFQTDSMISNHKSQLFASPSTRFQSAGASAHRLNPPLSRVFPFHKLNMLFLFSSANS
jgi:hypothetical protein